MDVDRINAVEPAKSIFAVKFQIRRAIEAAGIPYTYVSCNCFAGYFLPTLVQPGATAPPRDKVIIPGDGNIKGKSKKVPYPCPPVLGGDSIDLNLVRVPTEQNRFMTKSFLYILFCFPAAVFNEEHDIGAYTIKAVDDPRALNKTLYIRPPKNTLSFNELVAIREKLIGKTLEKIYVPEEQILKDIQSQ